MKVFHIDYEAEISPIGSSLMGVLVSKFEITHVEWSELLNKYKGTKKLGDIIEGMFHAMWLKFPPEGGQIIFCDRYSE